VFCREAGEMGWTRRPASQSVSRIRRVRNQPCESRAAPIVTARGPNPLFNFNGSRSKGGGLWGIPPGIVVFFLIPPGRFRNTGAAGGGQGHARDCARTRGRRRGKSYSFKIDEVAMKQNRFRVRSTASRSGPAIMHGENRSSGIQDLRSDGKTVFPTSRFVAHHRRAREGKLRGWSWTSRGI